MIIIFEGPRRYVDGEGDVPSGYRATQARAVPPVGAFVAVPGDDEGRYHEVIELTFGADLETVTVALEGRRVRTDFDRGDLLPGWHATEAAALDAIRPPGPATSDLSAMAAREAMPVRPRRRLNWYHFPDAHRSTIDARARIRFYQPKVEGDRWGEHRNTNLTVTIEVGAMQIQGEGQPYQVWSSFSARLGLDHRSGSGLARAEVLFDNPPDAPVDALAHAVEMAERWAESFMGPGWVVLTEADARRSHPPPALSCPLNDGPKAIDVHFEDGGDPMRLVVDQSGVMWVRPGEPAGDAYDSGAEAIDGRRIERVEEVKA